MVRLGAAPCRLAYETLSFETMLGDAAGVACAMTPRRFASVKLSAPPAPARKALRDERKMPFNALSFRAAAMRAASRATTMTRECKRRATRQWRRGARRAWRLM